MGLAMGFLRSPYELLKYVAPLATPALLPVSVFAAPVFPPALSSIVVVPCDLCAPVFHTPVFRVPVFLASVFHIPCLDMLFLDAPLAVLAHLSSNGCLTRCGCNFSV